MSLGVVAAFALVAVVAIAIPGPTTLLALANGSRFGVRRATYGMLGAIASDIVLVTAVAVGLGAVLLASEFWFSVVKWVGVAYLVYFGIRLLLSKGHLAAPPRRRSARVAPRGVHEVLPRRGHEPEGLPVRRRPAAAVHLRERTTAGAVPDHRCGVLRDRLHHPVRVRRGRLASDASAHRRGALWLDRICGAVLLVLAGALAITRRANA